MQHFFVANLVGILGILGVGFDFWGPFNSWRNPLGNL